jgi:hopanoid biosynthesis associated radical SAM protein HpnH
MRFPFTLTRSMAGYLLRKKFSGQSRFPLVLMLEPLHACNLSCAGCGRIREYAKTMSCRLTIDQCLAAVKECGAPIVSICGGEPLIYPKIEVLIKRLIARRKHIYLCTNGLLLEKKLPDLTPNKRLFINVHLDGMEDTHDRMVQREGVFSTAVKGIEAAKKAGFMVCTNTTIYKDTNMHEIAVLFSYLTELGIDGMMISPAYGYEAVTESNSASAEEIFMSRQEVHEKFRMAKNLLGQFKLTASPIYLEFLRGQRELKCAAWANPTYNVRGWRGPCYLRGDTHYLTYKQLVEITDWERMGHGNDPQCENCMVHCGFEPAAVLAANKKIRDIMRMAVWQMT